MKSIFGERDIKNASPECRIFWVFMICTSEVSHLNRFLNSFPRVCMLTFARANKFSIETSNSTHAITFRLLFLFIWVTYFSHPSVTYLYDYISPETFHFYKKEMTWTKQILMLIIND